MKLNKFVVFAGFLLISVGSGFAGEDYPLHKAVENGNLKEVKRLILAEKMDVDVENDSGDTPLHFAAMMGGQSEIARFLIDKGAKVDAVDNRLGNTPLHYAAKYGYLEVARLLLGKGANVDARDKYGQTPLLYAAFFKKPELASLLARHGAYISVKDKRGKTLSNYLELDQIRELINESKRVEKLFMAVKKGDAELVEELTGRSPEMVNTIDREGSTPLLFALELGHADIAKFLIEKGANVTATDKWQDTPLHLSAWFGFKDVTQLLIEKGANVNAKDSKGRTPLTAAISQGKDEIQQILTDKGAVGSPGSYRRPDFGEIALFSIAAIPSLILAYYIAKKRGLLPWHKKTLTEDEMNAIVEDLVALRDDQPAFDAAVAKLRREVKKQYVEEILSSLATIFHPEWPAKPDVSKDGMKENKKVKGRA